MIFRLVCNGSAQVDQCLDQALPEIFLILLQFPVGPLDRDGTSFQYSDLTRPLVNVEFVFWCFQKVCYLKIIQLVSVEWWSNSIVEILLMKQSIACWINSLWLCMRVVERASEAWIVPALSGRFACTPCLSPDNVSFDWKAWIRWALLGLST